MNCKVRRIGQGKIPTKTHTEDACYDMYAREVNFITDSLVEVKLGVALEPPVGYRVAIYPRSSISQSGWILANSVGIGDQNYRGEYKVYFIKVLKSIYSMQEGDSVIHYDKYPFPYAENSRVCQMELVSYSQINFIEDELLETARGKGGFGSTGNT